MNRVQKVGTALVITTLMVAGAAGIHAAQKAWQAEPVQAADSGETVKPLNTITVAGEGEIKVDPDVAYVTFGIETLAKTAKQSQADNAAQFAKISEVLYNQYQLSEKDVQTVNFSVNPQYKYVENKSPEITGYVVRNLVQVTYRDLDNIGKLLDSVSEAGVNRVQGISFGSEKLSAYEIQALDVALANAKAKATAIAKSENRTIQGVLNVVQGNVQRNPIPFDNQVAYKMESMSADMASTSISGGQLTVKTSVTVQYEF